LVGRPPIPTGSKNALKVLSDPLTPPRRANPAVPRELDAIAARCLERERDRRYQSAAELADDLDRWLAGRPTAARPLGWAGRAWLGVRRTPRATLAAWAMAGVATAAAIGAVLFARPPAPPVTRPAVDPAPLARLRDEFATGRAVTLVPATGPPRWTRWAVGRSDVTTSPGGHEAAHVHPFGTGALALFDPPADRYRAECELLHETAGNLADPVATRVGLFVGHQRTDRDGARVDSFVVVGFRDYDLQQAGGANDTQPVEVASLHLYRRPNLELHRDFLQLSLRENLFATGRVLPGRWRKLTVEVSPDRLRVFWWRPVWMWAVPVVVADLSSAEIDGLLRQQRDTAVGLAARLRIDPALLPTAWNPSGGFGVWAGNSGLTFRNVTVTATPHPAGAHR
jgi:serine/threonine-protein kinase